MPIASSENFIALVILTKKLLAESFPFNMWRLQLHSVIVILIWTCLAASQASNTWCLEGIVTAVSEFLFVGQQPEDYYGNICRSNLSVVSFWANAKVYCTNEEIISGQEALESECVEYGHMHAVPYSAVAAMLTNDFVASLPVVTYSDIDPTKVWNTSIMLDPTYERSGLRTVVSIAWLFLRIRY